MNIFYIPSRCTQGNSLKFKWYGFPPARNKTDESFAVMAFLNSISRAGYEMNEYLTELAKAEFEYVLSKAKRGLLRRSRDVKSLRADSDLPLFEIRFQSIGVMGGKDVALRMYHSEPIRLPDYLIGHHVHVKDISNPDKVNELQDLEIEKAIKFFQQGLSTNWGVIA